MAIASLLPRLARGLLLGGSLTSAIAAASSIVELSAAERARLSDRVVLAQVLESRTVVQNGDVRRMTTVTRLIVGESYKGDGTSQVELYQLGGRHGLWEARVPGDATFEPGETVLVFLRCTDAKKSKCSLVGLGEGKVRVLGGDALVWSMARKSFTRRKLEELVGEVRQASADVGTGKVGR